MSNQYTLIEDNPLYRYNLDPKKGCIYKTKYSTYIKAYDSLKNRIVYVLGKERYVDQRKIDVVCNGSLYTFRDDDAKATSMFSDYLHEKSIQNAQKIVKGKNKGEYKNKEKAEEYLQLADTICQNEIVEKEVAHMEVYIVVKTIEEKGNPIPFNTNEAVFTTEDTAKEYIEKRKRAKDRDDKGCKFKIEPWHVSEVC